MILFATIFLVPLAVSIIAYFISQQICWREFAIIFGVQLVIACISAGICYSSMTDDVQIINGFVTQKQQEKVSCSHSYECHCRTVYRGSGKDRRPVRECDTCYEHTNDWDWVVRSNVGEVEIARIDRQGSYEPPRFKAVRLNEPFMREQSYENYVKASPGSLFRHQGLVEKYQSKIPAYPSDVYDYYRLNRLVVVGGAVTDEQQWNDELSELNAALGGKKQVNIVVVIAKNLPPEYFYALEQAWIGGKKNDVILVVGTDNFRQVKWANVMAWTSNELFKVQLRDAIVSLDVLERRDTIAALRTNILSTYARKPMADFHYLVASITPSPTQWAITLIIGLITSILMSVYFHRNETFPEYNFRKARSFR